MDNSNVYTPYLMRIEQITEEAPLVKTFRLKFVDEKIGESFTFRTGQFGEYSSFGDGESTFCISSSPTRKGYIECTFRETGKVTSALAMKGVGDIIGFRGPYGNHFPIDEWKGKNLLFIAGGIALPPMRSVIWNCLDLRDDYKDITIIYGARRVDDLVYKHELKMWDERPDVNLVTTVDAVDDDTEWNGRVGFVPTVVEETAPTCDNTIAIICGPPIMIKFTFPVLLKLGFTSENIFTTLENRMKCGIGKCGRCNVGNVFVCKDGPVFSDQRLNELPAEY